ncbi:hypothetical protein J7E91_20270 [Streptomyces sp. ISL-99]|nr:hypothetical protein [Streptomyces sp. ISL-99]MBT2527694.1 hypothetical protein [Streptomyces sp. ISL-99]
MATINDRMAVEVATTGQAGAKMFFLLFLAVRDPEGNLWTFGIYRGPSPT